MSLDMGDLSIRIGPLYDLKDGLCFHRGEGGFEPTMKHTLTSENSDKKFWKKGNGDEKKQWLEGTETAFPAGTVN